MVSSELFIIAEKHFRRACFWAWSDEAPANSSHASLPTTPASSSISNNGQQQNPRDSKYINDQSHGSEVDKSTAHLVGKV